MFCRSDPLPLPTLAALSRLLPPLPANATAACCYLLCRWWYSARHTALTAPRVRVLEVRPNHSKTAALLPSLLGFAACPACLPLPPPAEAQCHAVLCCVVGAVSAAKRALQKFLDLAKVQLIELDERK